MKVEYTTDGEVSVTLNATEKECILRACGIVEMVAAAYRKDEETRDALTDAVDAIIPLATEKSSAA